MLSAVLMMLATAQADVTVTVGSISANGLSVQDLNCQLDRGGFLASAMVVGALAGQKPALDACSPAGGAYQVSWSWAGGATANATVTQASDPAQAACISTALQSIPAPATGSCTAVVLVGEAEGAAAAVGTMQPVTP